MHQEFVWSHANEGWVAEFAGGREFHATDLDELADERASLSVYPQLDPFLIGETRADVTHWRLDDAKTASVLATSFNEARYRDIVSFFWFDLNPSVALTENQALESSRSRAMELVEDVVGAGIEVSAEFEPRVELIEAVEMVWTNGGCARFRQLRPGGDDGVAEGMDEELAVARLPWPPYREVTKRLTRAAEPASAWVMKRSDAIEP